MGQRRRRRGQRPLFIQNFHIFHVTFDFLFCFATAGVVVVVPALGAAVLLGAAAAAAARLGAAAAGGIVLDAAPFAILLLCKRCHLSLRRRPMDRRKKVFGRFSQHEAWLK